MFGRQNTSDYSPEHTIKRASTARNRGFVRAIIGVLLLLTVALGGGFLRYLDTIADDQSSRSLVKAKGIVVLTGGYARLEPAAQLLADGYGARLLVSGVNETISQGALSAALGTSEELFSCCVDIDRKAMDTIGNAREVARWASEQNYESIILVTNDYHMPRSLSELQRVAPDLLVHAYPVSNAPADNETATQKLNRYRVLFGEYAKLLLSKLRPA